MKPVITSTQSLHEYALVIGNSSRKAMNEPVVTFATLRITIIEDTGMWFSLF